MPVIEVASRAVAGGAPDEWEDHRRGRRRARRARRSREAHGTVGQIARVLKAARRARAGVPAMARRSDGGGAVVNCLLLAATKKSSGPGLLPGSPRWAPVAQLAPADSDYVLTLHGIARSTRPSSIQILRNLGVQRSSRPESRSVGVLAMTIEAVNAGYQVVVPREAVTGTPDEYVAAVMQHTLRLLATIAPVDDVLAAWR
jgi:nicotinamidase-related amidase